ncbi:uncharacterized protein LOC62_03G003606 [Vanrija pseudolonga]|uniref:Uncharacterized protein n=1 Tax=Vanrija pseudolonga TaxID=143232 RepID=A0AAF0Y4U0_9TREE|nr:hypothetical protein LOC62_03G003606 [Vanrija pseudolonga]
MQIARVEQSTASLTNPTSTLSFHLGRSDARRRCESQPPHHRDRTLANASLTIVGPDGTLYAGSADVTLSPGKTVVVSVDVAPAPTSTTTITVTASAQPLPSTTGAGGQGTTPAILGGTLGGLLALALLAIAMLLLFRHRRRPTPRQGDETAFSIESVRTTGTTEERVEPFLDRRVSFLTTRARGSNSGEWERSHIALSTISSSSAVPEEDSAPSPAPTAKRPRAAPAPSQRYPPAPASHPNPNSHTSPKRALRADGRLPIYAAYGAPLAVRNPTEAVAEALVAREADDAAPPSSPLRAPRPPGMERTASASSMATSLATSLATTLV